MKQPLTKSNSFMYSTSSSEAAYIGAARVQIRVLNALHKISGGLCMAL